MTFSRRTVLGAGLSFTTLAALGPRAMAKAAAGGVLKIGTSREMNYNMLCFSLTGDSMDYVYSWPVYESLFKPNASGTVDPWLLEASDSDPEAMTYTFHIRKGVTFSDGTPLDAEAMKWNLDHYMEVGSKRKSLLGAIKSIDIVDDHTVKLQLSEWSSIIPTAFSREPGYMFSKKQFEEHGQEFCQENPVGTGPFVLQSWKRDVEKVFVRNETYWGGPVKLDGVKYTIYKDALVGQAAMMSGDIDAFAGMANTGFAPLKSRGFEVAIEPLLDHCSLLAFNSQNTSGDDPTGNLKVRQAICHAIDVPAVVAAAYHGLAQPTNQFGIGKHYWNDAIKGYPKDLDKARALLKEAGYAEGFKTKLAAQQDPESAMVLQIIQANLKEIGIDAEIELITGAAANQAAVGWGTGMWYQTSSVYVNVAMQMASMFRQNLSGNALGQTTMLHPDDVEAALAKSVQATSDAESVDAVKEANRLLVDEYAIFLPIAEYPYPYVLNKKVRDSGIGASFYSVATLDKAYLD